MFNRNACNYQIATQWNLKSYPSWELTFVYFQLMFWLISVVLFYCNILTTKQWTYPVIFYHLNITDNIRSWLVTLPPQQIDNLN